jgi:hypothetical protein
MNRDQRSTLAKLKSKEFRGIWWNLGIVLEDAEIIGIALSAKIITPPNRCSFKRDRHDFHTYKRDTQIPPNFAEFFA